MRDFKIDIPICNQYDDSHNKEWAHRMCAICSLWMLLKEHNSNFNLTSPDLVKEGVALNGYMENVGWKHTAIVQLGKNYGLELQYAQKFFYTPEEKLKGLKIIQKELKKSRPLIVSMFYHLNPAKGGHMVVVHGIQEFNKNVIGLYIQDPDSSFKGHNYFLLRDEFLAGWRGGMIWQK